MKIEVVSHCYRYARLQRHQLSSLVLHPPIGLELVSTVVFTKEDSVTTALLDEFASVPVSGLTWNRIALPTLEVCRRSIGRNRAALATQADWVWFTDADYCFGSACWLAFLDLPKIERPLFFPKWVQTHPDETYGDRLLEAVKEAKGLLPINRNDFKPFRNHRAIGGIQIVRGDVCRERGYLRDSRRWQRPPRAPMFQRAREDVAFRRSLGTNGHGIDLPEVFRIRHTKKGRTDPTAVL
jgi:hypothetical protein